MDLKSSPSIKVLLYGAVPFEINEMNRGARLQDLFRIAGYMLRYRSMPLASHVCAELNAGFCCTSGRGTAKLHGG